MYAVVCKISILQQLGVSTGPVWEVPLMDDLTVNIDEIDRTRACEVGEERVSRRHVMIVEPSQTKTPADQCTLLHDFEPKLRSVRRLEQLPILYALEVG